MPEFLTDEQAALIWSGQTTSIANLEEPTTPPPVIETPTTIVEEKKVETLTPPPGIINDKDISNAFAEEELDEDEDEDEDEIVVQDTTKNTQNQEEPKKSGRKPTDLITVTTQLIEENVLKGFEDAEIKTIDDVKELIKLNLESVKEESKVDWWKEKVDTYSPQIQAILMYAERGGTDVSPLLTAIGQVEEISNLTVETTQDQEEIVRQVLKLKNFDSDEIEDQISTLKDLDKLKTKAEKFLPELNNMKQRQLEMLMNEQQERQHQAQEYTQKYLTTIQSTLSKDTLNGVKLQREDKAKIYDSLAANRFTSLSGVPTNGFVKRLEDLQFGEKANYEEFLNIVHHVVDPQGFLEKIKDSLKNEINAETVKKLKSAKSTNSNYEEPIETRVPKKNTVSRSTFKNPFA